ncbi:MAG: PIN domain-containing protein [Acidobacteriota bacterium]|nr:PIN domain-containing protein [Acidobacteriota bacterium]
MIYVLDSSAMIALANNELGADVVADLLADPQHKCFAHAINLCEVFYDAMRRSSEAQALKIIADLRGLGVIERRDLGPAFWQEAGSLKAIHRRVSLADCCALALTLRLSGELVTSDHHELDILAAAGICPIKFFR